MVFDRERLVDEDDDKGESELSDLQRRARAFFFPRADRKLRRRYEGHFESLDKMPDWFEYLSLVVIFLNMIAMALYDPTDRSGTSTLSKTLDVADYIFIVFFTIEVGIRVFSFGIRRFIGTAWNLLDTFVVISGWIAIGLASNEFESFSGIRAVRVLRPLRTVNKFPSVKLVVQAMLRSMKDLVDVGILYFLFVFTFSAAGVSQFGSRLRKRCVNDVFFNKTGFLEEYPEHFSVVTNMTDVTQFVCGSTFDTTIANYTSYGCNTEQLCDPTTSGLLHGYRCPWGYTCHEVENPYYGFVGFDNIIQASLTVQAIVSLELFPQALYFTMDSADVTAAVYNVVVVVIGTFFIINLLVAVISVEFQKCQKEDLEKRSNSVEFRKVRAMTKFQSLVLGYSQFVQSQHDTVETWERTAFAENNQKKQDELAKKKQEKEAEEAEEDKPHPEPTVHIVEPTPDDSDEDSEAKKPIEGLDRVRMFVRTTVVETKVFHWTTMIVILISIALMATEYHGMSDSMENTYNVFNVFFTIFITVEMILRFLATTPWLFFTDVPNMSGVVVVLVSWIDVALDSFRLPAIRALRLVIAIKLVQRFPTIYKWILIMLKAFRASVVLLFIMVLDVFIFACLGMQLFGGKFCGLDPNGVGGWCDNRPRLNFDAFGTALLTSFQLMTGDDWNFVMYDAMRAAGAGYAILFVAHHFIAVYILVNLFVAILIDASESFQEEVMQQLQEQIEEQRRRQQERESTGLLDVPFVDEVDDDSLDGEASLMMSRRHSNQMSRRMSRRRSRMVINADGDEVEVTMSEDVLNKSDKATQRILEQELAEEANAEERRQEEIEQAIQDEDAKPNFYSEMPFYARVREGSKLVLGSRITTVVMLLTIFTSTITLSLDSPVMAPDEPQVRVLKIIDVVCTGVFIAECVLQILAFGFIMSPRTYLRRTKWNILDFFLVLCGIADLILSNTPADEAIRTAKILYVLRPLRVLRRSPGIQVVTKSLLAAIPAIKDVMIVALIFWTVFGITGVQLFKGTFYSCTDTTITRREDCHGLTQNTTGEQRRWVNANLHFDHFPAALLSLFVVSTFEGWSPVMHSAIDSVDVDHGPSLNNNPPAAIFFVAFCVVGGFFLTNLFISVLINTYEQEKKRLQKQSMFLTMEQEEWLAAQRRLLASLPVKPFLQLPSEKILNTLPFKKRMRMQTLSIVQHPGFEMFIFACIGINAAAAATEHYPMNSSLETFLSGINYFLTFVFVGEAAAKIFALGHRAYFESNWNRFDFCIVLVSLAGIILEFFTQRRSSFGSVFRTLRLIRLVRVLKSRRNLAEMVKKFVIALYALNNVAALVALFITLFALLCNRLFGRLRRDNEVITHNANFENFINSALMLFRVITGGGWPDIMAKCRQEEPECLNRLDNCGEPVVGAIVFVVFFMCGTYILLNIFVAVIMDSFSEPDEELPEFLNQEHAEQFVARWLEFDTLRALKISNADILPMLRALPSSHPFHFNPTPKHSKLSVESLKQFVELRFLAQLNLFANDATVEFFDLLMALNRVCLNVSLDIGLVKWLKRKFERKFSLNLIVQKTQVANYRPTRIALHEWYAAMMLWNSWKRYKEQKEFEAATAGGPGVSGTALKRRGQNAVGKDKMLASARSLSMPANDGRRSNSPSTAPNGRGSMPTTANNNGNDSFFDLTFRGQKVEPPPGMETDRRALLALEDYIHKLEDEARDAEQQGRLPRTNVDEVGKDPFDGIGHELEREDSIFLGPGSSSTALPPRGPNPFGDVELQPRELHEDHFRYDPAHVPDGSRIQQPTASSNQHGFGLTPHLPLQDERDDPWRGYAEELVEEPDEEEEYVDPLEDDEFGPGGRPRIMGAAHLPVGDYSVAAPSASPQATKMQQHQDPVPPLPADQRASEYYDPHDTAHMEPAAVHYQPPAVPVSTYQVRPRSTSPAPTNASASPDAKPHHVPIRRKQPQVRPQIYDLL